MLGVRGTYTWRILTAQPIQRVILSVSNEQRPETPPTLVDNPNPVGSPDGVDPRRVRRRFAWVLFVSKSSGRARMRIRVPRRFRDPSGVVLRLSVIRLR